MSDTTLLTRAQLAQRLQVGLRTIDRFVASGTIRTHRLGRTVRFDYAEVLRDTQQITMDEKVQRAMRRA